MIKALEMDMLVWSLWVPEPLHRTRMPIKPWIDIAVDCMGPLLYGHNIFYIVDYFSKFTEVVVMKQITETHLPSASRIFLQIWRSGNHKGEK